MDPLRAELTPPHQGRAVRFLRRSREGGSQREGGGGKEKDVTFFVDPAPKINLVEAHLIDLPYRARDDSPPQNKRS
jgi:hypothetical protein